MYLAQNESYSADRALPQVKLLGDQLRALQKIYLDQTKTLRIRIKEVLPRMSSLISKIKHHYSILTKEADEKRKLETSHEILINNNQKLNAELSKIYQTTFKEPFELIQSLYKEKAFSQAKESCLKMNQCEHYQLSQIKCSIESLIRKTELNVINYHLKDGASVVGNPLLDTLFQNSEEIKQNFAYIRSEMEAIHRIAQKNLSFYTQFCQNRIGESIQAFKYHLNTFLCSIDVRLRELQEND